MFFSVFLCVLPLALSLVSPSTGSSPPQAVVYTTCTDPKIVALTFDDGPYIWQTNISDMLTSKGAKGTFFVNGHNYNCIYSKKVAARLQYTYLSGHQICSHTWSHPYLTKLNETQIGEEITKNDVALLTVLGIKTKWLRPPYGSYNARVQEVAYQYNKSLVTWNMDSKDSLHATVAQSKMYYDQAIASAKNASVPGLIMLNHETVESTVFELLEYAIDALQAAGFVLGTFAECMGFEPYTYVGPIGTYDNRTWFCPEDR